MDPQIEYRVATLEDTESISKFLQIHYCPEEPMSLALQVDLDQQFNCDLQFMLNLIEYGTCIIALNGKKIVGALLSGPKYPDAEQKMLKEAAKIPNTKWEKLLIFLAEIERLSNVFEKYNVDKAVHGHGLAVDEAFRGNGIGLKICAKAMERAKELGYPLYTSDSSSIYSAKLCERLGMDCVNVKAFADFRMPDSDEQVFFPPGEHKFVKSYALRLVEEKCKF